MAIGARATVEQGADTLELALAAGLAGVRLDDPERPSDEPGEGDVAPAPGGQSITGASSPYLAASHWVSLVRIRW